MPKFVDKDRTLFEEFKELYSEAQSEEGTGVASLDVLLAILEPSFSRIVENLSMPHWFNEEVLVVVGGEEVKNKFQQILDELTSLPFVRSHPRGYAYHDAVRKSLFQKLARKDTSRIRELSQRLVDLLKRQDKSDDEEITWERVYLTLGYDETAGLKALDTLFMENRRNRRFTVCDNLVNMASEQRALLSPEAVTRIDYYRGLLALDLQDWEDAETIFKRLVTVKHSSPLAGRIQLHLGLTLEAQGNFQRAERVYESALNRTDGHGEDPDLMAKLYQRLAQTYLTLGDLKNAEAHAKQSLAINQETGDRFGESLNLESLGRIYEQFKMYQRAQEMYEKSLALLDEVGREFDKSRIYCDLATLHESHSRWEDAEGYYQKAIQIKVRAGDNYGLSFIYSNLGNLYLKKGEREIALNYFRTALSAFQKFKDRFNSARILCNIALAFEHHNDITSAVDHMRRAIQQLPDGHRLEASYQRVLSRLEKNLGKGKASSWKKIGIVIGITVAVLILLFLIIIVFIAFFEEF